MDKIAIISDVHGNLEALKTVLSDIKKRNINKVYCLGDTIAKGAHAHECIKLVKENCDVVLMGNTDELFSREFTLDELKLKKEDALKRIEFNKSMLTKEDEIYLRGLPYSYEFYLSGRLVRLFHATPDKIDGFIGHVDKLENYYKLFLPSKNTMSNKKADIVICGHAHMQELQKMYNRTIINTGSVGNPVDVFRNIEKDGDVRNTNMCNYLIIKGLLGEKYDEISYEFINIPYDIEKEISSFNDINEEDCYIEELRYGKYRYKNKIEKSLKERGIDVNNI